MNIQMELRKCCNHPFLVSGVEQLEMQALEKKLGASALDPAVWEPKRLSEGLIKASGKMVLIDKLLPKLKREGHKVLIFSQMVMMLNLLEEYCESAKYNVERLDGGTTGKERQKSMDRFNTQEDSFCFLLSTRAGGVGINLTAADTCIIFDSDWNPQNDVQAMARCHRIGQKRKVHIYRLVTRNTFEGEMFERASKKLGLEHAVLGTHDFNDNAALNPDGEGSGTVGNSKMDSKEMEQLLRQGAYALMENDEAEVQAFCEEDIDSILNSRSRKVEEQKRDKTESWLSKRKNKLNTHKVNKSSFTASSSTEYAQVDVNDPDFWRKVLPEAITPAELAEKLNGLPLNDFAGADAFIKEAEGALKGILDLRQSGKLPDGQYQRDKSTDTQSSTALAIPHHPTASPHPTPPPPPPFYRRIYQDSVITFADYKP